MQIINRDLSALDAIYHIHREQGSDMSDMCKRPKLTHRAGAVNAESRQVRFGDVILILASVAPAPAVAKGKRKNAKTLVKHRSRDRCHSIADCQGASDESIFSHYRTCNVPAYVDCLVKRLTAGFIPSLLSHPRFVREQKGDLFFGGVSRHLVDITPLAKHQRLRGKTT